MNNAANPRSPRAIGARGAAMAVICLAVGALALRSCRQPPPEPRPLVEISRDQLALTNGRLFQHGATNPFTGVMLEAYESGAPKSRSHIEKGQLHGISLGFHTNGQIQIREFFTNGVSHGVRTKWHPNGTNQSEGTVVGGVLNGPFRRWHENGQLAEQMRMTNGEPHGVATSYHTNGFVKGWARLEHGKIIESRSWKEGELRQLPADIPAEAP